jgi:hypothetical protein
MGDQSRISFSLRSPPTVSFKLEGMEADTQTPSHLYQGLGSDLQFRGDLFDAEVTARKLDDITFDLHGPGHQ